MLCVLVRVEQAVERAAGIVGARRGELLMPALHADRRGQRREPQIERRELDLDAAFRFLVGEGLADAVGRGVGGIGEADLVVLVVAVAEPEPDRVDRGRLRAEFAFAGHLGLVHVDAGVVGRAVEPGDVIEAVELRDRGADKAAVENVRAADRLAVGVQSPSSAAGRGTAASGRPAADTDSSGCGSRRRCGQRRRRGRRNCPCRCRAAPSRRCRCRPN